MSIPTGYDAQTGHMDFSLALREMKKGKKVRCASWPSGEFILLNEKQDLIDERNRVVYALGPALVATDWEEVL